MSHKTKSSLIKILITSLLLLISVLSGCTKQSVQDNTQENVLENVQETVGDSAAETKPYVPDTGYKQYSCEESSSELVSAYVQMDINPSFILGMTGDCKVISITANNEDAEDVLSNGMRDYFADTDGEVELEYVLKDIAKATKQCGYIEDTFDVSVTVISGSIEEDTFANACDSAKTDLSEDEGIKATFERVADNNGGSSDNPSYNSSDNPEGNQENNQENSQEGNREENQPEAPDANMVEDKTCDMCHGAGSIVCDLCNGEGIMIEIEEVETEVRNDYVCPYCGGEGILDDGMHGGETAVCGHCGGEGRTGTMSGDFRELAFDIEIVEEEVERPCSRCNGEGVLTCSRCNGTGVLQ